MEAVSNAWHSLAIKPKKMRNHGGKNWGKLGGIGPENQRQKRAKPGGKKKGSKTEKKKAVERGTEPGRLEKKTFVPLFLLKETEEAKEESHERRKKKRKN